MSGSLLIRNRQRAVPLNTKSLRVITTTLLNKLFDVTDFDLAIYIVRAPEMARLNEKYLQHTGSTDVITFDYGDSTSGTRRPLLCLHGEIFVCIDDAVAQARAFRTSWQSELARYIIHGVLHLRDFDDTRPAARRKMKRHENRLLKEVARLFPLRKLAADSRLGV